MHDIAAIERATLAAVPPQRQETWQGWLLPYDDGTVGRCHSAVPLRHEKPADDALAQIERRYAEARLPAVLRIPEEATFDTFHEALRSRGYRRAKPTLVQTGTASDLLAATARANVDVDIAGHAGPDWENVFLGEGFDPRDGGSRLAILRRGRSLFASVRENGHTVAVGAACIAEGWCGLHGMRTLPAHQGRGLAGAVLAALGRAARERGVERCFLQVDAGNAPARALYARRGFATAWTYAYWKQ